MKLKELSSELLRLSPEEKNQAIQLLIQSLNGECQGIDKTPNVMGGEACIRQTRIPVWLLVSLRDQGGTDAFLLDNYPSLSAIDRANAWFYASTYSEEIEQAIKLQEEA